MAIKFTVRDQPASAPASGKTIAAKAAPIAKESAVTGEQADHGTDLFPAEPKAAPSRKRPRK